MTWCVAWTGPSAESLALKSLGEVGLNAFLPLIATDEDSASKPLFPRYLFLELSAEWHRACRARGVNRLLGFPGPPLKVPVGFVEELLERGTLYTKPRPERLKVGEFVQVTSGPFGGWTGLVKKTEAERVQVLLSVFGRATRVTLGSSQLVHA